MFYSHFVQRREEFNLTVVVPCKEFGKLAPSKLHSLLTCSRDRVASLSLFDIVNATRCIFGLRSFLISLQPMAHYFASALHFKAKLLDVGVASKRKNASRGKGSGFSLQKMSNLRSTFLTALGRREASSDAVYTTNQCICVAATTLPCTVEYSVAMELTRECSRAGKPHNSMHAGTEFVRPKQEKDATMSRKWRRSSYRSTHCESAHNTSPALARFFFRSEMGAIMKASL